MSRDSDPNVLLLHSHDLGQHLGCYGYDVKTPAIDGLAADGARFEEYYCTAPQCGPSRSSIMTGRHPHENGLMGHYWLGWDIQDGVQTLPQLLNDAGYTTSVFGVQHLDEDPTSVGFDHVNCESTRAADLAPAVESYLDKRGEEPFFASVGFFEPHRLGWERECGFHAPEYDPPDPETVTVPPYLPDIPVVREEIVGLQGLIRAVDEAVARILDSLKAAGLSDDTLVLFTSDHGIAMPRAKGTCFDPGIETALVARYPGLFDGGEEYGELLSNVDLLPTVLDLVGVDVPDAVSGRSFLPLVADSEYEPRERIFSEMTYHDRYNPMRCVRTERYKYIRSFADLPEVYLPLDIMFGPSGRELFYEYYTDPRPEEELYDLEADPHEQENLIGDPEHSEVAEELRQEVDDWMRETDDPLLEGDVPIPDEHVQRLRTTPW